MSPQGNSPHLFLHIRREEVVCMVKNMYLSRSFAWSSHLMLALLVVLTACGGDSNTATATPAPTIASTTNAGTTNTPSPPSPTSIPPGQTPTSSRPGLTPTPPRPPPP